MIDQIPLFPEIRDEIQLELPLDQRYRFAQGLEDDHKAIPDPWTVPAVTCGRLGYCYCPKCNPR